MKDYILSITTPPNTTDKTPQVLVVPLLGGYLRSVSVMFYDGCLLAVGVKLKSYGSLIIPTNGGGWIIGNNERLEFYPSIMLSGPDYHVEVETCNYAVDYSHTVNIRLEVGDVTPQNLS